MQSLQPLARNTCPRQIPRCLSLRSRRCFHDSTCLASGHSRWSTIKHDKAKADASKNKQRSVFSQELALASKLFGPDPNNNPRLADLITKAKRNGFPKASIESSILRGQGKSASGAALEALTVEAILPHNIACIIECETEGRLRTLADVKHTIKEAGGNATPTQYLFEKRGRLVLETKEGVGLDQVFDAALELGAIDVEQDEGSEGRVVVFTEPADTKATGESLSKSLGLDIAESDIIWSANDDTMVEVDNAELSGQLVDFVDKLEDKEGGVTAIYMNVRPGDNMDQGAWGELMSRVST